MMPQAWKVTRYQPDIFRPEKKWRRTLFTALGVVWALFWGAVALWLITGGAEARLLVGTAVRSLTQLFSDAISALAGLFQ